MTVHSISEGMPKAHTLVLYDIYNNEFYTQIYPSKAAATARWEMLQEDPWYKKNFKLEIWSGMPNAHVHGTSEHPFSNFIPASLPLEVGDNQYTNK